MKFGPKKKFRGQWSKPEFEPGDAARLSFKLNLEPANLALD